MQIEIGIPLIIVGFLVPIAIYLLYRRYKKNKGHNQMMSEGEIFDKTGEDFNCIELGTEHSIPKKKSIALLQAMNKLKSW